MDTKARRWTPERVVVIAALAFGVAAGSYGIANAASGLGSGSSQTPAAAAPSAGQPWGRQRSDDGTPVTVYVSKRFDVVSVESGMPGPPGRAPRSSSGASV